MSDLRFISLSLSLFLSLCAARWLSLVLDVPPCIHYPAFIGHQTPCPDRISSARLARLNLGKSPSIAWNIGAIQFPNSLATARCQRPQLTSLATVI
ncbi:hypothetical protein LZ30DRAFT_733176 [Colletotrichum cereale]|nr:hypothetical protein LZ30DRAFT_733176 [Colletotrichum cereale]